MIMVLEPTTVTEEEPGIGLVGVGGIGKVS